ncbi:hypothetical protein E1B28_011626 [Marasmius oreades]|uniref:HAT C-terminal dimerisation domain-containing protein n=1 Tax=Marasmius oreades TaxID=181124 RepID=A0A9P7USA7_9AGAR|nr:uncharacterized protein E1B28_011626 [Marasmius oreades]KAG7090004.1 hypothetical protein E1B28_011626 [Marasmius oreades]
MESHRVQADENNTEPNLLDLYHGFSFPGRSDTIASMEPPLIKLRKRVLSISANSASCERLFSVFGNILTKLQNQLGTPTLSNLAELKMLIRDEYLQSGEAKT